MFVRISWNEEQRIYVLHSLKLQHFLFHCIVSDINIQVNYCICIFIFCCNIRIQMYGNFCYSSHKCKWLQILQWFKMQEKSSLCLVISFPQVASIVLKPVTESCEVLVCAAWEGAGSALWPAGLAAVLPCSWCGLRQARGWHRACRRAAQRAEPRNGAGIWACRHTAWPLPSNAACRWGTGWRALLEPDFRCVWHSWYQAVYSHRPRETGTKTESTYLSYCSLGSPGHQAINARCLSATVCS